MIAEFLEVRWQNVSEKEFRAYEAELLKLNCDKALHLLDWEAILPFKETVRMTAEWYSSYYKSPKKINEITISHIKEYQILAKKKGMRWATQI